MKVIVYGEMGHGIIPVMIGNMDGTIPAPLATDAGYKYCTPNLKSCAENTH
jgi:hypothetical protein